MRSADECTRCERESFGGLQQILVGVDKADAGSMIQKRRCVPVPKVVGVVSEVYVDQRAPRRCSSRRVATLYTRTRLQLLHDPGMRPQTPRAAPLL